jgi:Ca-activated chloride channel family protein
MHFLYPQLAWWVVAALAAVIGARRGRRRYVGLTTVRWLASPTYRASALRRLPLVLLVAAAALLAAALMQPVLPYSQVEITSRGLDIVVALDLSSSMLEEMGRIRPPRSFQNLTFTSRDSARPAKAAPSRLTATKEAIKTLVARRRDDRIALVVFSDNAYVISPLTFDRDYVIRYVDLIDEQLLKGEGMTAIGDGLAVANDLLARQGGGAGRRNQVVVLFTDGENNKGRDPIEVLGESHEADIRVHMVGVDLEEEVRRKPQVQRVFQSVRRYGGRYFNASTARDLELASETIDRMEKGVLVSRPFVRDAPVYHWFALPALLCLAAGIGVRAIPFFVDYT